VRHDLFACCQCTNQDEIDAIVEQKDIDVQARIRLLAGALPKKEIKDYARTGKKNKGGHKALVFSEQHARTPFATDLICKRQKVMKALGLWVPDRPGFASLPPFSAFIQFEFTLTRPYLSRDDEIFHICDNPVRKDKVFKVPMVAGTGWKGNLRWTMMKTDLEPARDDPKEFTRRRLRHTLLFGTEKGFTSSKNWEKFLDHRCTTDLEHHDRCKRENEDEKCRAVRTGYRRLLCKQFGRKTEDELPHIAGWLRFYPTFLDSIGLEVINPHDRRTRAGKNPIYFESVQIGAKGTFSLLYVPLGPVTEEEAREDLKRVTSAISEMMLLYGFSAKKTSGFGEAGEKIKGFIQTSGGPWPLKDLSKLEKEAGNVQWA
jgi:CRISPR-associated protein Cmr2